MKIEKGIRELLVQFLQFFAINYPTGEANIEEVVDAFLNRKVGK